MNFQFNKNGVTNMVSSINNDRDTRDEIEIIVNGNTIIVPMCADNVNEIEYSLKSMLVSEQTGVPTRGNSIDIAKHINEEFDRLEE
jgi:hypothetical protein